jgi:hypothetical protein
MLEQILKDIRSTPSLKASDFGFSLAIKLVGIRDTLQSGGFFSRRHELALENWGVAVARHVAARYPADTE